MAFQKKIKAFTIAEMQVVLVISGIAIGLTMLVLSLVQKQLRMINSNFDHATEVRLLERVLLQDFNKHNLFFYQNEQQLQCISEIDTIVYKFNNEYVIRNLDTLQVPVVKFTGYFDGGATTGVSIDAIELQLSNELPDHKLFISKTKDATFYMNSDGI